ncbi:MAG TPA: redoxin domain-containing protein [Methanomassiliicoccales archaeon]|nr:redoxin domain-containing protein [Methanomassiliicoccales archaeon]
MDKGRVPKIGQKVLDFVLPDDMGRSVRLSEEASERIVVLMFYPSDFGMICSIQMGELRDSYDLIEETGVRLLPISTNSVRSHAAWKESMRLPFRLLADEDGTLTEEYGMSCDDDGWFKNRSCRGIFMVDRDLTVLYSWVPESPHTGPDVPALIEVMRSFST